MTHPLPHGRRSRWRSGLVVAASVAVITLITVGPAAILAPAPPNWVPEPLAHWAFDIRLALATPAKGLASLRNGDLGDRRIFRGFSRPAVRMGGDEDRLVGTLYLPDFGDPRVGRGPSAGGGAPAVLLLHGSTPKGKELGLYRLLASGLARRGALVLTLDQRGYGDSADPADVADPRSFTYVPDAGRAVAFLAARRDVDPARVHILGHSFGGDVALAAGASMPGLASVIALGPSRRFTDKIGRPGAPQLHYFRRREMRYMRLREEPPESTFLKYRATLPVEALRDYYGQPGHVPVLLIDGTLEGAGRLEFLRREYRLMASPKRLVTLEGADHYMNVADVGPLVSYDPDVMARLLDTISDWIAPGSRRW